MVGDRRRAARLAALGQPQRLQPDRHALAGCGGARGLAGPVAARVRRRADAAARLSRARRRNGNRHRARRAVLGPPAFWTECSRPSRWCSPPSPWSRSSRSSPACSATASGPRSRSWPSSASCPVSYSPAPACAAHRPPAATCCACWGPTRATELRRLALPSAIPGMAVAFRLASPQAVLAAMVAEFLMGTDGLGSQLPRRARRVRHGSGAGPQWRRDRGLHRRFRRRGRDRAPGARARHLTTGIRGPGQITSAHRSRETRMHRRSALAPHRRRRRSPVRRARADAAHEGPRFGTDWLAEAEHGGFYQAVATGAYRKHGLDVTIRMGGPQSNPVQAHRDRGGGFPDGRRAASARSTWCSRTSR